MILKVLASKAIPVVGAAITIIEAVQAANKLRKKLRRFK